MTDTNEMICARLTVVQGDGDRTVSVHGFMPARVLNYDQPALRRVMLHNPNWYSVDSEALNDYYYEQVAKAARIEIAIEI